MTESASSPLLQGSSRDPAIEDWSNLRVIHPLSKSLLAVALGHRISANAVSLAGLTLGLLAALAYYGWKTPGLAFCGFLLSLAWLIADGLDGMVARATGTASFTGRILDGLCDHGVFIAIYLALAASLGSAEAWVLAWIAGLFHTVQSGLYEAERARYHRRIRGDGGRHDVTRRARNPLIRFYDTIFHALDRWADGFDRRLRADTSPERLASRYREKARAPMKAMTLLSANTRIFAIFLAAVAGDPRLFWWFEIVPLSIIAIWTIGWHRRAEARIP